jgi:TonB family protein
MMRHVGVLSALLAAGAWVHAQQTVYSPEDGVSLPSVVRSVPASYTSEAMRAHIEGTARVELTVLPDGSVEAASIKVTHSLDRFYGLDDEVRTAAGMAVQGRNEGWRASRRSRLD